MIDEEPYDGGGHVPSPQRYVNWMIKQGYTFNLTELKHRYRNVLRRKSASYSPFSHTWELRSGRVVSEQEIESVYDPRNVPRFGYSVDESLSSGHHSEIDTLYQQLTDAYTPTKMNSPGNVTKSEAMMANMCVVRVSFSTATKATDNLYSYLAPADFDKAQEPFVVVPSHEASAEKRTEEDKFVGTDFKVAKVHEIITVLDDDYEGTYKRIVAGFNPIDFMQFNVNATKKKKMLEKLKKMGEELSSVAALEKLLAGNPEAEALLAEYKKL